jgi:hypothetical protein
MGKSVMPHKKAGSPLLVTRLLNYIAFIFSFVELVLEPRHQLHVQQTRRKPVWHGKYGVGKILDEQI